MRVNVTAIGVLGLVLVAGAAGAQSVTVTPPSGAPVVVDCSVAPGCVIAVAPVVVAPPPPPCTWTVSPLVVGFPAAGGSSTVQVRASRDGCGWTAQSDAAWLTAFDVAGGIGLTASANTATTRRTATALVAGQSVLVTQDAAPEPPPPPPPPPTGTVLARLDCARGFPDCGIGYWGRKEGTAAGVYQGHTVSQVGNGARFRLTPATSPAQFYMGWQFPVPVAASTANAIYLRFHLTINAPFRASGVGDVWTDKLVIVNNGTGMIRAIGELKPIRTADLTDVTIGIQKNIDGGVTLTPRQDLVIGRRYAVQMRISRGSAVRFATCLDQSIEALCVQSGTFSYAPTSFANVALGFYSNAAVASGGSVDFTIEDAEIGTAFDGSFR